MNQRSHFASNLAVASGTLVSRATGLVRIAVFAAVVGQTALADAFDIANNAPNVIYELLLGGTLTATLIPLLVAHRERNDRSATAAVFGTSMVALAAVTALAIVVAPFVFRLYSLSPTGDVATFRDIGTALTRVFFVQIFFYGLNALAAGALNAHGKFLAAAWAPVAANVVSIAALLAISVDPAITQVGLPDAAVGTRLFWWFSLGPTVGIAAMSIAVVVAAVRANALPMPRFAPTHPAVRSLLMLSGWAIGYIAANQITLIVVKNLADPGSGRLDAYAKAMVLFQLPHGLLAVTIATTVTPLLARAAAQSDRVDFQRQFTNGARLTVGLTLLPCLAMVLLAKPIVRIVLGWGEFSTSAVDTTARALAGLAIGLVGFSLYLFALRGFYSHSDTRTPFYINVGQNALNIALAVVLVTRYDVLGLGLAFAMSYLVFAVVTVQMLHHRHGTPSLLTLLDLRPLLSRQSHNKN